MAYYTCLLLDADNTLLDFDAAERQAMTDTLMHYELPYDEAALDTYHSVNRQLWDRLAKGELSKNKLFSIRFGQYLKAMGLPDNGKGREMNDYYEDQLSNHADLLPGALSALHELAEVATLAIVSNGAYKVQKSRIGASGLETFMDGVYISEKIGATKPNPKISKPPCGTWASRTVPAFWWWGMICWLTSGAVKTPDWIPVGSILPAPRTQPELNRNTPSVRMRHCTKL